MSKEDQLVVFAAACFQARLAEFMITADSHDKQRSRVKVPLDAQKAMAKDAWISAAILHDAYPFDEE